VFGGLFEREGERIETVFDFVGVLVCEVVLHGRRLRA
jgi:hypothetical protein